MTKGACTSVRLAFLLKKGTKMFILKLGFDSEYNIHVNIKAPLGAKFLGLELV